MSEVGVAAVVGPAAGTDPLAAAPRPARTRAEHRADLAGRAAPPPAVGTTPGGAITEQVVEVVPEVKRTAAAADRPLAAERTARRDVGGDPRPIERTASVAPMQGQGARALPVLPAWSTGFVTCGSAMLQRPVGAP